jgi:hypothetical protein
MCGIDWHSFRVGFLPDPDEVGHPMYGGLFTGVKLVLLFLGLVVLIGIVIACIRIGLQRQRLTLDKIEEQKRKFLPDGRPVPPAARGICQVCQNTYDRVYHFPSGTRLCPACYKTESEKSHPSVIL